MAINFGPGRKVTKVGIKPGSTLQQKPNFTVGDNVVVTGRGSSGIGITGPTGSGPAEYQPPKPNEAGVNPKNYRRAAGEAGFGLTAPGGSGSPQSGWVDGKYVEIPAANRDRAKPKGGAGKTGVGGAGNAKGPSTGKAPSGGAGKTGVTGSGRGAGNTDGGSTQNAGQRGDKKPDSGKADAQAAVESSSGGKRDSGSSSTSSTSAPAAGKKPGESKTVPAVPGTLNYFMKKAAASGDKNVKNRAYQMYKNYKDSKFPKGMNVDPSKIPANPKKGDAVKGKAGVTWTWNGQRWTRGKAAE